MRSACRCSSRPRSVSNDELAAAVAAVGAPPHVAEPFELVDEAAHVLLGLAGDTGELGQPSPAVAEVGQDHAVAGPELLVAALGEAGEELPLQGIQERGREHHQVGIATADVGGDAGQTAIADGLQTGLYVLAAGALVAIPAALALPNRVTPP